MDKRILKQLFPSAVPMCGSDESAVPSSTISFFNEGNFFTSLYSSRSNGFTVTTSKLTDEVL